MKMILTIELLIEIKIKWWCNTLEELIMAEDFPMNVHLLMFNLIKSRFRFQVQWSNLSNHIFCLICMDNNQEFHHLPADSLIIQVQRMAIRICQARLLCSLLLQIIPNSIETNQVFKHQSTIISNRVGIPLKWFSQTITKSILSPILMRHQLLVHNQGITTSRVNSRQCILARARCLQLESSQRLIVLKIFRPQSMLYLSDRI